MKECSYCATDHPQPIVASGTRLPPGAVPGTAYCGRCWIVDKKLSPMEERDDGDAS